MPLSDVALRNAKPREKPYKLADAGGLFAQVTPQGSKLWRLKYRYAGKEKLLSIGPYPLVSLAEARAQRDEAKRLLRNNVDPAHHKRATKDEAERRSRETFGHIAAEYVDWVERNGRNSQTVAKLRWMALELAAPLADKPIRQITSADVLECLRKLEARGLRESTLRCRATVSRVFRFAMAGGRATDDPTYALQPKEVLLQSKVRHHAAITSPKDVGELMRAIDCLEGSYVVRTALKLLAYCYPRPGTLRLAQWSEFDLGAALWKPPIIHMKKGVEHEFPLPRQAVALLSELQEITGCKDLVFPGIRSPRRPLSENTLNVALRRLGYSQSEMTSHGFRTTASTLLNESKLWHPDAIERSLAHVEPNSVRAAYARGQFWDERVSMAQWWADYLDRLRAADGYNKGA